MRHTPYPAPYTPETTPHTLTTRPLIAALLVALWACAACGGELENSVCNPIEDEDCVCSHDETGRGCIPPDPEGQCTCGLVDVPERLTDRTPPATSDVWHHVLIRDRSPIEEVLSPGFDLDAVELIDQDGVTHYATTVEEFLAHNQPTQRPDGALGPPDALCHLIPDTHAALGGRNAKGLIRLGFSAPGRDVTFGPGTTITIHSTRGPLCPSPKDPYQVYIATDTGDLAYLGDGAGTAQFTVR